LLPGYKGNQVVKRKKYYDAFETSALGAQIKE